MGRKQTITKLILFILIIFSIFSLLPAFADAPHHDDSLPGRGQDMQRKTYVEVIGYAVVYRDAEDKILYGDDLLDIENWMIPTYQKGTEKKWKETGVYLPHKTEVICKEEFLRFGNYGAASGYLLVESAADGTEHWIDVFNFVTRAYWEKTDDLITAVADGMFVAEFHQKSPYTPCNTDGNKAFLGDSEKVLVVRKASQTKNIKTEEHGLEVKIRRAKYVSTIYVNVEDLTLVY